MLYPKEAQTPKFLDTALVRHIEFFVLRARPLLLASFDTMTPAFCFCRATGENFIKILTLVEPIDA